MTTKRASRSHLAASFLFFGLTGIMAIILLLLALVVWLTEQTGSLTSALLIVGGSCTVLCVVTYLLVVRDALADLREHFETVYEVARLAHTGYEWVTKKLNLFLNLAGK